MENYETKKISDDLKKKRDRLDEYKNKVEINNKFTDYFISDSNDIAKLIHANIESMTHEDQYTIITKILNPIHMKHILLDYELKNIDLNCKMENMYDFVKFTQKSLSRYNWKAGGFLLEDSEWTLHHHRSKKYSLTENEVVFENSILDIYRDDERVMDFLRDIEKYLRRHKGRSIGLSIQMVKTLENISWTIIKIFKKEENSQTSKK